MPVAADPADAAPQPPLPHDTAIAMATLLLGHSERYGAARAGNARKLEQQERRLVLEAQIAKDRELRRGRVNNARQSLQRSKHAMLIESELEQQGTRVRRHTDKVRVAAARKKQEAELRDKRLAVKRRREERRFRRRQIQESLAFSSAFIRSHNTAARHVQLGHNERRKADMHQRVCEQTDARRNTDAWRRTQVLVALEQRFNARRAAVLTQKRVLRQKIEWRRALDDQEQQLCLIERRRALDLQDLLSSIRAASAGVFSVENDAGVHQERVGHFEGPLRRAPSIDAALEKRHSYETGRKGNVHPAGVVQQTTWCDACGDYPHGRANVGGKTDAARRTGNLTMGAMLEKRHKCDDGEEGEREREGDVGGVFSGIKVATICGAYPHGGGRHADESGDVRDSPGDEQPGSRALPAALCGEGPTGPQGPPSTPGEEQQGPTLRRVRRFLVS